MEHLSTKSCPCHNKEATNDDNHDDECKETIKMIVNQFHHVKYNFFDEKGNVIAKVLPAICSQNDLEDHLFIFMKTGKISTSLILRIEPEFIKMML